MADQAQKDRFVAALTELSGPAGNGRLREALQWDEAVYNPCRRPPNSWRTAGRSLGDARGHAYL